MSGDDNPNRLHPRTIPTETARSGIQQEWNYEYSLLPDPPTDRDLIAALHNLTGVLATEVEYGAGLPSPTVIPEGRRTAGMERAVLEGAEMAELTQGELLGVIASLATRAAKMIVQIERHPGEPDKRGDTA